MLKGVKNVTCKTACFVHHLAVKYSVCPGWYGQSGRFWVSCSMPYFIRWRQWFWWLVVSQIFQMFTFLILFKYCLLKLLIRLFWPFGVSDYLELTHSSNQNLTGQVGTQLYASPEQASIENEYLTKEDYWICIFLYLYMHCNYSK
jgi:serine/threonine protein kinase